MLAKFTLFQVESCQQDYCEQKGYSRHLPTGTFSRDSKFDHLLIREHGVVAVQCHAGGGVAALTYAGLNDLATVHFTMAVWVLTWHWKKAPCISEIILITMPLMVMNWSMSSGFRFLILLAFNTLNGPTWIWFSETESGLLSQKFHWQPCHELVCRDFCQMILCVHSLQFKIAPQ